MFDKMPRWAIVLVVFCFFALFVFVLTRVSKIHQPPAQPQARIPHIPWEPTPVQAWEDPVRRAVLSACSTVSYQLTYIETGVSRQEKISPAIAERLRQEMATLAMYPANETENAVKAIEYALRACEIVNDSKPFGLTKVNAVNGKIAWAKLNLGKARQSITSTTPVTSP